MASHCLQERVSNETIGAGRIEGLFRTKRLEPAGLENRFERNGWGWSDWNTVASETAGSCLNQRLFRTKRLDRATLVDL